jgi:hypothetical protein
MTTASVIAPAVLFEDLDLEPAKEETPKPPIVPPPTLTGQAGTPLAHARGSETRASLSEPRPSGSGNPLAHARGPETRAFGSGNPLAHARGSETRPFGSGS